ncbi:hypothetical protein [Acinetobacter nectaris]|nr:hypothetical protein [Acinetobacter nectaris]
MRKKCMFFIAFYFTLKANAVFADEQIIKGGESTATQYIPSGLRIDAGLNGYGGAVLWDVNNYVSFVLGYEGSTIDWKHHTTVNGRRYQLDQVKNKNTYVNAEIHPWGESHSSLLKSFYIATGVGYLNHKNDLHLATSAQTKVEMSYSHAISPYLGFGAKTLFAEHWGMFGEVGAYYVDHPLVSSSIMDVDTYNDQYSLKNDSKYQWLPVAKLGVIYKF